MVGMAQKRNTFAGRIQGIEMNTRGGVVAPGCMSVAGYVELLAGDYLYGIAMKRKRLIVKDRCQGSQGGESWPASVLLSAPLQRRRLFTDYWRGA